MDTSEIVIVVLGLAAISLVLWFFFGEKQRVAATVAASGVEEVKVTVKGGYSPDVIVVKQHQPVRLDFYRDETASCSDRVIIGDFGIARDLPAFKTTSIEFIPDKSGEFSFTCGMNMMRGKLVVEDGSGSARQAGAHHPTAEVEAGD